MTLKFFFWRTRDGRRLYPIWLRLPTCVLGAALLFAVTPSGKNAWAEEKPTPFCDEAPGAQVCLDRSTGFTMFDWGEGRSLATKDDIDAINKKLDEICRLIRWGDAIPAEHTSSKPCR